MRIPSSAKTTAATGHSAQNSGHRSWAWSMTSGSVVNARGITSARARKTPPMTSPATSDSSIMRRAAAKASSASPAPSARPTMTCPAIAIASSTRARKPKSWKAIWWAATVAAPMRAHTAVASTKQPSSAAVRTNSCAPIDTSERMRARSGQATNARSSTAANAIPIPSCASTVPQAEPSRPQSKP